jgi:hypothetical protein
VPEPKKSKYDAEVGIELLTEPRLSQILNLLNLHPAIQEAVLFLPRIVAGPNHHCQQQRQLRYSP